MTSVSPRDAVFTNACTAHYLCTAVLFIFEITQPFHITAVPVKIGSGDAVPALFQRHWKHSMSHCGSCMQHIVFLLDHVNSFCWGEAPQQSR